MHAGGDGEAATARASAIAAGPTKRTAAWPPSALRSRTSTAGESQIRRRSLLLEDARRLRDAARDDVERRQHRHEDREEMAADAVRCPHDDEEDEDEEED